MKKTTCLLTLLLLVTAFVVACGGSSSSSEPTISEPTITVLVYLEGTDLEANADFPAAKNNITEMLAAASSPNVNIVLTTGAADKAVPGDDVDNWRRVRRYLVRNHKLVLLDDTLGALDMGNPQVLTDFITWGQDTYPADKYVLVFWDHGGGAQGGFGGNAEPTAASYASTLTVQQLKDAVEKAVGNRPERRFELVGFDACLMATIEVADAFMGTARYLAASQELEPGSGWDWTGFVNHIVANPGTDGASLGGAIADSYQAKMDKTDSGDLITFSVINLAKVPRINDALAAFSRVYNGMLAGSSGLAAWSNLASARSRATDFAGEGVDLSGMFNSQWTASDGPEGLELENAIKDAVVKTVQGPYTKAVSGLNVMFPAASVWHEQGELEAYNSFDFVVPEYKALVKSFSAYARSSVPDMTFGSALLLTDAKTMSANITSPVNPRYEQVYIAISKQLNVVSNGQAVTQNAYLGFQPTYSTSGDASQFSYTSNSKWFTLNGKLASVLAEPTTEKGPQVIKIPMHLVRTVTEYGNCGSATKMCWDGLYYLIYNFDSEELVKIIGFVATLDNNQFAPPQQLVAGDVVSLRYFVVPTDSTKSGAWSDVTSDELTFTMGSSPPVFVKTAIPAGNDFAFVGFDLRLKQFVSNSVRLK